MDKIVDKFYNGSIQNGGFKPRLTSNKFSSPNLLENKYNRQNGSSYNQRYNNGQQIIENAPVPRTQYSIGLRVPTIRGNPPLNPSITNPFKSSENPYSTLQKNYGPNQYKLSILNNRIREMEDENARNRLKIQRLMEGSSFAPEKPYWNSNPNYVNNPNNLNEAMNNLRSPYLTMQEFKNKQDMRRNIVQYELEKARQRIHEGNDNQILVVPKEKEERNYTLSNYSSNEDNESSLDELDKKMKKEYKKLIKQIKEEREYNEMQEDNMNNIEDKLYQMERQNVYNNEELNILREKNQEMYNALKSKEEAEDFINNIPDHVALQLQNDNFKIRSNLNTIKEGFREIKNDLENKLEALELKQNHNFEVIKRIIEEGGNRKFKVGFRKYLNNEDIDLNEIQDELPEHLQFLPYLIEKKIKENEEMKNQEKNRLINERMNKKFDSMEYDYGYANKFYKYKNNYKPFNQQSKSNNNFVISKNYGRFQYIPKQNNKSNNFKQNAEQNLMIMKEKEDNIPGLYAYGVGNKNMNDRIPIRMNGCYDDWFKDKQGGEFQLEETQSDIGLNAIKKKIKTKSNKSQSLKSKEMRKSESSESKSETGKKSKHSKKDKKEDKKENKKEDKKDDKKEDKKKDKKKEKSDDESEGSEESDEEDDEKSEKDDKKSDKDDKDDDDEDDDD